MTLETPVATREKVRVFVTGSCDGLAELREALERHGEVEIVGWTEGVRESASTLTGGHLQVVLHGTRASSLPEDELAAIREHTPAPVILLASGEVSALLEQALDADVSDVLLLPQMTENVVFAIRKASHSGRKAGGGHGRRGRVVTVFSPKGGTGKTVTATNLSSAYAKYEGKKALLLDLDLQFGDAAIMLGLEPEKTIYDLVVAPGELDSEKLAGYTCKHSSGLEVLAAPLRPEDAELVTEAKLLRLALQTLELLSFPKQRIKIVLNRSNSKVGMKQNEVEGALGMKVRFEIPSDRAVPLAVNRGKPVVLDEENADVSKAIRQMAKQLFTVEEAKAAKRRLVPAFGKA